MALLCVYFRQTILSHARRYCETTTLHGFAYWVGAPRIIERLLWFAIVAGFGSYAAVAISSAFADWSENPGETKIKSFSKVTKKAYTVLTSFAIEVFFKHISEVNYPAITFCNPASMDAGKYVETIFNRIEYNEVIHT